MVVDYEIDRKIARKQTKPKFEAGQTVTMNSLVAICCRDYVGISSKVRRRFWVNGTKGNPTGWVYELEERKSDVIGNPRHTCWEWLLDPA